MKHRINWDALGITTSIACAIHCAILPLLLSSLPILGVDIVKNAWFEYGMIALAFLVGVQALSHGFRHHHHQYTPILVFTVGILFLLAKQVWHSLHIWLLIPAVIAIVSAHVINFRLCRIRSHQHGENCRH
ncbi:MAG: MerC domain-containing protein [Bacteroidota bacterium]|nr:MerC domain-containing protein [Bacteroidota bacterium]